MCHWRVVVQWCVLKTQLVKFTVLWRTASLTIWQLRLAILVPKPRHTRKKGAFSPPLLDTVLSSLCYCHEMHFRRHSQQHPLAGRRRPLVPWNRGAAGRESYDGEQSA